MIEVSAAVVLAADGSFLLAQRPVGKVYAGYWEFPGGKVEAGEEPARALARELYEELGIEIGDAYPWLTRVFTYPHGTVRLNFFRVIKWSGEPHPREGQAIAWQSINGPMAAPMLPANAPVLAALALPAEYAITNAAQLGTAEMLRQLERALERGLRLLQVREPGMDEAGRRLFTGQAIGLAHRYGCRVLTKAPFPDADGVHLTAADLMRVGQRRREGLVAASCHTRAELERAMELELDFAVLGPVKDKAAIGWEGFRELAAGASIPVYAVGGLSATDREAAWRAGAHGVAMIRAAWN